MNKAARVFVCYWNDVLVGMFSVLNLPSGTNKYAYRVHRMVILPDYQGLGIGIKLLEFFGEYFLRNGEKMYLRSSHIRLAKHCNNSPKWIEGCRSQKKIERNDQVKKYKNQNMTRTPFSFEYVGEKYNNPHQVIICMGETSKDKAQNFIEKIINKSEYPIIVSGIASIDKTTIWETIAKEKGIRTEILYTNQKGKLSINASKLKGTVDGIIIGQDNQKEISQYKHSKEFRSIITYNYKYNPIKYIERNLQHKE